MGSNLVGELPLGLEVQGDIIGTSRTTEVKRLGDKYVLKELRKVGLLARTPGETESEYRARRLARSIEIFREEKELADLARNFIPKEVVTYPESFFIANGSDGFPTPYKVQELSEGKTLRNMGGERLSNEVRRAMSKLVVASVRCFMRTGKVFDIVGCVLGDGDGPLEEVLRHLNPVKYASNLLVVDKSKLVFIDARVGGGNLLAQVVSLMTLVGYYWNGVLDKLR